MERDFCAKCGLKNPPCIVNTLLTKSELDKIAKGNRSGVATEFFVCAYNATRYEEGVLKIEKLCVDCETCHNLCVYSNEVFKVKQLLKVHSILKNLPQLAIFLRTQYPDFEFWHEVKAEGDSRVKRIDIVAKSGSKIILFKVLEDNKKINYYIRSYIEIVESLMEEVPATKASICILLNNENGFTRRTDFSIDVFESGLTMISNILEV
ncbi:MAG: hypothetical protein JZU49_06220 [Sulfuricurvum sp.]|nr:hypothetical protein [Sulfuricurvum sp.]